MSSETSASKEHHVNPWVVLTLVCMAQFMVVLDATVVNVALPTVQSALHITNSDRQWIVTAYTLTFGGFLLLGGRAGDLFGRQKVFLTGIVVFTLASLFNGLATSSTELIIGRAVQGFGGALISPAALSIITTTFAEGAARNKALGVWSGIAASGAAFGLIIGGGLTQTLGWRYAFFVNVPVGILTFILAARMVPDSRVHGQKGVDVWGAATVTAGLISVVYAISSVSRLKADGRTPEGWGSSTVITWGLIGVALLVAFFIIENIYRAPIVRLGIFRSRSLSMANLAMFLVASGMFAMFFFLSFYIQGVLNYKVLRSGQLIPGHELLYGPFKTGLAFLPFCFGIGIGAGLAAQFVKKFDVRLVTCIGGVIAASGFLLLLRLTPDSDYLAYILPPMLVMSIGMGLTFVPVTMIATTNVAEDDAGLSSGLLNTSQQVGGSLGLAILATLATNRTTDYLGSLGRVPTQLDAAQGSLEGFKLAFVCGAVLLLAGMFFVAFLIRSRDVAGIKEAAAGDNLQNAETAA